MAWHAGVALIWAREAMSRPTPATERPEIWYAVAFAIAAVVILIAAVVAEKRSVRAAIALFGVLAVALVALTARGRVNRVPAWDELDTGASQRVYQSEMNSSDCII